MVEKLRPAEHDGTVDAGDAPNPYAPPRSHEPLPAPETPRNSGIASSAISGAGTSTGMVDRRAPTSSET